MISNFAIASLVEPNESRISLGAPRTRHATSKLADASRLFFDEVDIKERVGRNPLESDESLGVDQEGAVQGDVLEVVVGAIGVEAVELGIGKDRHREFHALFVRLQRARRFEVVGADRHDVGVEFFKRLELLAKLLKLLHAVRAFAAEEEDDDDVAPLMLGE